MTTSTDGADVEQNGMHIRGPQVKNEFNWTTGIAIVGLLVTVGGLVFASGQFKQSVSELSERTIIWQDAHVRAHQEAAEATASSRARTDSRLSSLETEVRQIDNLAYRMAAQEQGTNNLANSVAELRKSMNDMTGDIRVIREILTRMDKQQDEPR